MKILLIFIIILNIILIGSNANDLKYEYLPHKLNSTRIDNTIWGRKSYTKLK